MMKWNASWLMVLCVLGMGAILFLPALGVSLGGLLAGALVLLCPLSHLLMMRGMHSGHGSGHGGSAEHAGEAAPRGADAPRPLSADHPVPAIAAGSSVAGRAERGEG